MAHEIELVNDGDGVTIIGRPASIERFLHHAGLLIGAQQFNLTKLTSALKVGANVIENVADIAEQSAMYLKLTPESTKRLKDAGGLMGTKTKGVSHAMIGETGKKSLKWLQVDDSSASMLTNPALLSGVAGIMSKFAQQNEAQEFKALLVRIDGKLDDVRRAQRDSVLAKMKSAAAAIEEAITIREHGGDPKTLWDKVSGTSESILNAQEDALLALDALADRVSGTGKARTLRKTTREIDREVALQLAILARCFELQDEFSIVELDHVSTTAPEKLDGHRIGIADARARRRLSVLEITTRLMAQLDTAGAIANENIILHERAARSVIDSLNSTSAIVDDFHIPLGIESSRGPLKAIPLRIAFGVPQQRRTAFKELGQKALVSFGAVGVVGVPIALEVVKKSISKSKV